MLNKIVNNVEECETLGKLLSGELVEGDVLSLEGDLGSGKTTFVKGILKGLDYKSDVTSPTFTLINEYNANLNVIHIDFYREKNIDRWINLGIHEYFDEDNLVIIEWPNLIPDIIPEKYTEIFFEHLDMNKRRIYLR